jgi:thiamine biosynthesis lipoprotein ApbE
MGTAAAHFRAMGADVQVLVVGGPPSLLDEARELVEALEARWSRFRPTSEISRLNQLAGRPVRVSQETLTLVRRALDGASVTAGRYDPTVLGAVLRAGYDRSFELLAANPPPGRSPLGLGYRRIAVDAARSTVTLPPQPPQRRVPRCSRRTSSGPSMPMVTSLATSAILPGDVRRGRPATPPRG